MSEFRASGRLEFDPDRRRDARAEIESGVTLEFSGQEYVLIATDISAGGLATSYHEEILPSSEGAVTFTIGDSPQPVSCRCRVIYSADGRGLGVEFLDLSDESRQALKKLVDESN